MIMMNAGKTGDGGGGGTGTVTSVSVTTANGVSGSVANATTTPAISITLGAITPTTVNGLTITTTTGTFTLTNAKTLAVTHTLTLSGTDGTVMTFPTTTATIARTDAANTFTGNQTFSTSGNFTGNGASIFSVGTTSFAYRNTNGGSGLNYQSVFNTGNSASTAGAQAFGFQSTDGLVFCAANGTRQISRAAINIINLGNTATSESADLSFLTQSAGTAMSQKMRITGLGSVIAGAEAAIATNATDGFLYIPTCAGTPSGTPTAVTGKVAMVFDTTNNKFYVYDAGWLGGTAPGVWS